MEFLGTTVLTNGSRTHISTGEKINKFLAEHTDCDWIVESKTLGKIVISYRDGEWVELG